VVLVKKKNNIHRLCVDMRKVNSVTKPIFFPLPLLEDVFETVAENNPSTFSVLDLTSGFWQIKLDESSNQRLLLLHIPETTNSSACHSGFRELPPVTSA